MRRELIFLSILSMLAAALLFAGPLFGDRCTLSFRIGDPRIDLRPWVDVDASVQEPINPITPDINGFVLPGVIRARQLMEGDTPLWDGTQLLGYPFAANISCPLFSPPLWLLQGWIPGLPAADPVTTLDLMLWFHVTIALILAFRACRIFKVEPAFAALGAVGFALSAWMYTSWHAAHILYTTVWWPGQLAALERLRQGHWRRAVAEGALFTGLMLASGFPQVGLVLTGSIFLLAFLERSLRNKRALLGVGLMVLLGALLASPQLWLSSRAYKHSLRSTPETLAATAERALPPASLITLIYPEFFGRPSDFSLPSRPAGTMEEWLPQRLWWSHNVRNTPIENALYPGVLLLLLLTPALRRSAGGRARHFLLLGLIAVIAAMAGPWVVSILPGAKGLAVGSVQRTLSILAVSIPLAAALGLQAVGDRRAPVPWITGLILIVFIALSPVIAMGIDDPQTDRFVSILAGQAVRQGLLVGLGLLCLALASGRAVGFLMARRGMRWLPAIILAVDLVFMARAFNPFPEQTPAYPETPAVTHLKKREGRVAVFGKGMNLLLPAAAGNHGIRSLHGVAPMVPTRTAELLNCIEGPLMDMRDPRVVRPFEKPESLNHPLLDLLGVDTVVHADPDLEKSTNLPELFVSHKEGLAALARLSAGPRAFLSEGARVVPDKRERLDLLADPPFPIHGTVLLERPPSIKLPETGKCIPLKPKDDGTDGRCSLEVDAPRPGVVVLTESWDPGWQALVDGEPAALHVVDHALMGVEVGPGPHEVVFAYRPRGLTAAFGLSALSLVAIAYLAFTAWRRSRR